VVVPTGLAQKRTEMYVNHLGIAVPSVPDALAFCTQKMGFREAVSATDPGAPSAFSRARLANATDLNGVRIELAEFTPESLQRKAIDSWK
jgi:catechol 2,3-dioxygenase-like lactoylglutathione lyase family enzyme